MKHQLEAIKLLKDWSTWLVTAQTGILSLFALIGRKPDFLTVFCFVISIIIATWILGALPSILQRIKDDSNIHQMDLFEWLGIPLFAAAFLQHVSFMIGVVSLSFSLFQK
jgi:hypothetical protein